MTRLPGSKPLSVKQPAQECLTSEGYAPCPAPFDTITGALPEIVTAIADVGHGLWRGLKLAGSPCVVAGRIGWASILASTPVSPGSCPSCLSSPHPCLSVDSCLNPTKFGGIGSARPPAATAGWTWCAMAPSDGLLDSE
jgi:hypothetical protein